MVRDAEWKDVPLRREKTVFRGQVDTKDQQLSFMLFPAQTKASVRLNLTVLRYFKERA